MESKVQDLRTLEAKHAQGSPCCSPQGGAPRPDTCWTGPDRVPAACLHGSPLALRAVRAGRAPAPRSLLTSSQAAPHRIQKPINKNANFFSYHLCMFTHLTEVNIARFGNIKTNFQLAWHPE